MMTQYTNENGTKVWCEIQAYSTTSLRVAMKQLDTGWNQATWHLFDSCEGHNENVQTKKDLIPGNLQM
jgi:hypothetical protein